MEEFNNKTQQNHEPIKDSSVSVSQETNKNVIKIKKIMSAETTEKSDSSYDIKNIAKVMCKPAIVQLEKLSNDILINYLNKNICKSENIKSVPSVSNINVQMNQRRFNKRKKLQEIAKEEAIGKLRKRSKTIHEIKTSVNKLTERRRSVCHSERSKTITEGLLKNCGLIKNDLEHQNDITHIKRGRRSSSSSIKEIVINKYKKNERKSIVNKLPMFLREPRVCLTRLEEDSSNNLYMITRKPKLKLVSDKSKYSKDNEVENHTVQASNGQTKEILIDLCEKEIETLDCKTNNNLRKPNTFNSNNELYKTINEHLPIQHSSCNKGSEDNLDKGLQSQNKKLKLVLIKLEDLGITKDEKYSALEVDFLTKKYLDFLMNSNFSYRPIQSILNKYINSRRSAPTPNLNTSLLENSNIIDEANVLYNKSTEIISSNPDHSLIENKYKKKTNDASNNDINNDNSYKVSSIDVSSKKSLVTEEVIDINPSIASKEKLLNIWKNAFCGKINNQPSKTDTHKNSSIQKDRSTSKNEFKKWLSTNQLVDQACCNTTNFLKSSNQQNTSKTKSIGGTPEKLTEALTKSTSLINLECDDQTKGVNTNDNNLDYVDLNNQTMTPTMELNFPNTSNSSTAIETLISNKVDDNKKRETVKNIEKDTEQSTTVSIKSKVDTINSLTPVYNLDTIDKEAEITNINSQNSKDLNNSEKNINEVDELINDKQAQDIDKLNISSSKNDTSKPILETSLSPEKVINSPKKLVVSLSKVVSPEKMIKSASTPIKKTNDILTPVSSIKLKSPIISSNKTCINVDSATEKTKRKIKKKVLSKLTISDLQCKVCHEVFTSTELLAEHIYKHTETELQDAYKSAMLKRKQSDEHIEVQIHETSSNDLTDMVNQFNSETDKREIDSCTSFSKENESERNQDSMKVLPKQVKKKQHKKTKLNKSNIETEGSNENSVVPVQSKNITVEDYNKDSNDSVVRNMISTRICSCHKDGDLSDKERLRIEMVLLCRICHVLFRRMDCFESHYQLQENALCCTDKNFGRLAKLFCSGCCVILHSLCDLRKHLEVHSSYNEKGVVTFVCHICHVLFFGIGHLFYNHWSNHLRNPFFISSRLSFPSVSVFSIKNDKIPNLKINISAYKKDNYLLVAEHICKNCRAFFATEFEVKEHIERGCKYAKPIQSESSNVVDKTKQIEDICLICSACNETFNQRIAFENHSVQHNFPKHLQSKYISTVVKNDKKCYVCNICSNVYETLSNFENHWINHVIFSNDYTCIHCNITFTNYESFANHFNSCTSSKKTGSLSCKVFYKEPPFSCNTCNKEFMSKETLMTHIKTHNQNLAINTNKNVQPSLTSKSSLKNTIIENKVFNVRNSNENIQLSTTTPINKKNDIKDGKSTEKINANNEKETSCTEISELNPSTSNIINNEDEVTNKSLRITVRSEHDKNINNRTVLQNLNPKNQQSRASVIKLLDCTSEESTNIMKDNEMVKSLTDCINKETKATIDNNQEKQLPKTSNTKIVDISKENSEEGLSSSEDLIIEFMDIKAVDKKDIISQVQSTRSDQSAKISILPKNLKSSEKPTIKDITQKDQINKESETTVTNSVTPKSKRRSLFTDQDLVEIESKTTTDLTLSDSTKIDKNLTNSTEKNKSNNNHCLIRVKDISELKDTKRSFTCKKCQLRFSSVEELKHHLSDYCNYTNQSKDKNALQNLQEKVIKITSSNTPTSQISSISTTSQTTKNITPSNSFVVNLPNNTLQNTPSTSATNSLHMFGQSSTRYGLSSNSSTQLNPNNCNASSVAFHTNEKRQMLQSQNSSTTNNQNILQTVSTADKNNLTTSLNQENNNKTTDIVALSSKTIKPSGRHENVVQLYNQQATQIMPQKLNSSANQLPSNVVVKKLTKLKETVPKNNVTCAFCPGRIYKTMLEFSRHINTSDHIKNKQIYQARKSNNSSLSNSSLNQANKTPNFTEISSAKMLDTINKKNSKANAAQTNEQPAVSVASIFLPTSYTSENLNPVITIPNTLKPVDNTTKHLQRILPNPNLPIQINPLSSTFYSYPSTSRQIRPKTTIHNQISTISPISQTLAMQKIVINPSNSINSFTLPTAQLQSRAINDNRAYTINLNQAYPFQQSTWAPNINNVYNIPQQANFYNQFQSNYQNLKTTRENQNVVNQINALSVNRTGSNIFTCSYCKVCSFYNQDQLYHHIESKHKYVCKICTFRAFNLDDILIHMNIHSNYRKNH